MKYRRSLFRPFVCHLRGPGARDDRLGSRPGSHCRPVAERMGRRCGSKVDDLVRQELTQHWYPHAVNRDRGGFHQSMARDWSLRPDENAFLVYQARMTWTAAAFARYSPAHHDEFVDVRPPRDLPSSTS